MLGNYESRVSVMPDETPDVNQSETDKPNLAEPRTEAPRERDDEGQPGREADLAEEDASRTPHTEPGEDAAGWKAASEAGKAASDDPRP